MANKKNLLHNNKSNLEKKAIDALKIGDFNLLEDLVGMYGVELPDFEIQLSYRTMFNELIEAMKRPDEEREEYNKRLEEKAKRLGLEDIYDLPNKTELKKQLLQKLEKIILVTGAKPSFHLFNNFIKELIERQDEWTIAEICDALREKVTKEAEEIVVFRDLLLSRLTGSRLHLAHLSTEGSVELVREAKNKERRG